MPVLHFVDHQYQARRAIVRIGRAEIIAGENYRLALIHCQTIVYQSGRNIESDGAALCAA